MGEATTPGLDYQFDLGDDFLPAPSKTEAELDYQSSPDDMPSEPMSEPRLPTPDGCEKSLIAILEEQYKSPLLTSSPVLQLLMRLKGKRAQACDKMSMNFC